MSSSKEYNTKRYLLPPLLHALPLSLKLPLHKYCSSTPSSPMKSPPFERKQLLTCVSGFPQHTSTFPSFSFPVLMTLRKNISILADISSYFSSAPPNLELPSFNTQIYTNIRPSFLPKTKNPKANLQMEPITQTVPSPDALGGKPYLSLLPRTLTKTERLTWYVEAAAHPGWNGCTIM